jgi:hypothetical protein
MATVWLLPLFTLLPFYPLVCSVLLQQQNGPTV